MPDQRLPHEGDFAMLPERERHIAGYVDALPEGAAMDIKSLARSQPLYGQMAVGSALRALGVAGHLRHVRCLSGEGGQVRWVTRTFWSGARLRAAGGRRATASVGSHRPCRVRSIRIRTGAAARHDSAAAAHR